MNPKIEQALSLLAGCPASDFAELAILAADQAGMSEGDQQELRATLFPSCTNCGEKIGDYEPTAKDRKLVNDKGSFCEECHRDAIESVRRQRRIDAYEDYERPEPYDIETCGIHSVDRDLGPREA